MPESFINLSEGNGKKAHTWQRTTTAGTVEDEVVLLGENYLPSYVVTASAVGLATANDHLVQIMAGASLYVRVRLLELWLWTLTTSSTLHRLELWRLSSAGTGGTAVTPAKLYTGDNPAAATAMTLPTVKGTEATKLYSWGPTVLSAVSGTPGPPVLRKDWGALTEPLIIAPGVGNGIALKNISTQAAGQFAINVEVTETSFP